MTPDIAPLLARIEAAAKAIPEERRGPWMWWVSKALTQAMLTTQQHGRIYLMGFKRWGMRGAEPTFQPENHMVPASDLAIFDHNGTAHDIEDSVARWIALCSPDAMLAVVAAFREMERERDEYANEVEGYEDAVRENLPECTCDSDGNLGNEHERIEYIPILLAEREAAAYQRGVESERARAADELTAGERMLVYDDQGRKI
jgi:hypothetical protein